MSTAYTHPNYGIISEALERLLVDDIAAKVPPYLL